MPQPHPASLYSRIGIARTVLRAQSDTRLARLLSEGVTPAFD